MARVANSPARGGIFRLGDVIFIQVKLNREVTLTQGALDLKVDDRTYTLQLWHTDSRRSFTYSHGIVIDDDAPNGVRINDTITVTYEEDGQRATRTVNVELSDSRKVDGSWIPPRTSPPSNKPGAGVNPVNPPNPPKRGAGVAPPAPPPGDSGKRGKGQGNHQQSNPGTGFTDPNDLPINPADPPASGPGFGTEPPFGHDPIDSGPRFGTD